MRGGQQRKDMDAKVLVIEETPEIATLISRCLAMVGMRCTVCTTGSLGFFAIVREHFDALILDVDCPASDGRAVITGLKRLGGTPIVVLTAWSAREELSPWWEMGVDHVVPKPFSPVLLAQCVRGVVCGTPA
jgi:two-component system response regulator AdeR